MQGWTLQDWTQTPLGLFVSSTSVSSSAISASPSVDVWAKYLHEKLWTNFDENLWREGAWRRQNRLDFGDDPDSFVDPGLFPGFFTISTYVYPIFVLYGQNWIEGCSILQLPAYTWSGSYDPLQGYGRSKFSKMRGRSSVGRQYIHILMPCTPLRYVWYVRLSSNFVEQP